MLSARIEGRTISRRWPMPGPRPRSGCYNRPTPPGPAHVMSSIADQLERRLAAPRLNLLRRAAAVAARRGARLYLVGGAVRDVLLGGSPTDLDVVADGDFAGLPDALASGLGGRVTARSQFDTAKLAVDDLTLDLARARTESYARPGALPDVRPGTMREDLTRRDFSVNAMAVSLTEGDWGVLLDPHGGAADLRAGLIRVLHPAASWTTRPES